MCDTSPYPESNEIKSSGVDDIEAEDEDGLRGLDSFHLKYHTLHSPVNYDSIQPNIAPFYFHFLLQKSKVFGLTCYKYTNY
jgi:hypothetical protein